MSDDKDLFPPGGPLPFRTIDWNTVPRTEHAGASGSAVWQTIEYPGLRVRIVEYSPGYLADHWCRKGHVIHCLEGAFASRLESGEEFKLEKGMTYVVSDDASSHKSFSEHGVRLLIIDGDFLQRGAQ